MSRFDIEGMVCDLLVDNMMVSFGRDINNNLIYIIKVMFDIE